MIFNNTNKLNFRLIKTFIYLSQYRFDVQYKLEKQYIVFDAFFNKLIVSSRQEIDFEIDFIKLCKTKLNTASL